MKKQVSVRDEKIQTDVELKDAVAKKNHGGKNKQSSEATILRDQGSIWSGLVLLMIVVGIGAILWIVGGEQLQWQWPKWEFPNDWGSTTVIIE